MRRGGISVDRVGGWGHECLPVDAAVVGALVVGAALVGAAVVGAASEKVGELVGALAGARVGEPVATNTYHSKSHQ